MSVLLALTTAVTAAVLFAVAGWLLGARRGVAARDSLRSGLHQKDAELLQLQGDLSSVRGELVAVRTAEPRIAELQAFLVEADRERERGVQSLRQQLESVTARLADQSRTEEASINEIRGQLATMAHKVSTPDHVERRLRQLVAPLVSRANEAESLGAMVRDVLTPLADQERLEQLLAELDTGTGLAALPDALNAVARAGGFTVVILSDDAGLPLAASQSDSDIDAAAGISALLFTLRERIERCNSPRPRGVVLHDEANQIHIHRFFEAGGRHFMLSATTRGLFIPPKTLDPVLGKLERMLNAPALARAS